MCVRAWAFRVNKFSLIYRCSRSYIWCNASEPACLSLSLFSGIYMSQQGFTHYLTIPKRWAVQNMWIKPQRLVCMTKMTSIMSHRLCCCCCLFGFNVVFNNVQSYLDGVWLRQGAQCSLLLCCVTEVSWPRHLTWYHTQSHYPCTASTSSSTSP